MTTKILAAALLYGVLSPTALPAQLTVADGALLLIADDATVTDRGARASVADGGRLEVDRGGRLVAERFVLSTGATAALQGEVISRGGATVSGELFTRVSGKRPGIDYGTIDAAGNVGVRGGTLTVTRAPGFAPADPSGYPIVSGAVVKGPFATANLPGPEWSDVYVPTAAGVQYRTAPVPVTWLGFDALPAGADVRLDWATAQERDADYFAVERLVPGTGDRWSELGRVAAAGTTVTERAYDFLDVDPGTGTHYYRLRQVDTDGTVDYSAVASATIGAGTALVLYPNPAARGTAVALSVTGLGEGPLTVRLYAADGREVFREAWAPSNGTFALPADLAAGIYQLELANVGGLHRHARLLVE